ncbi:2-amino-4-hydroxy-6-hydroxymethyldihydropteridine diphosphokinase [Rhodosalinus sp. FB01]|uniref:2-amino-4-hydroxy-6- hydroxymethyldihydropteridine diphosphokinase n=1 Tax=Rhodosalinus sp. FB01 TaxID=3239194 RepID=UPI0035259E8A
MGPEPQETRSSARGGIGTALIALGANVPRPGRTLRETLEAALSDLAAGGAPVRAVSRFYRTPCFPAGAGPDYVNAAAVLEWDGPPRGLLDLLHAVERAHGRERVRRWGRRTLDLDLLALGDAVLPDRATFEAWRALPPVAQSEEAPGELILPHPRMHERAFVLVPLAEVAPGWVHPVLGADVAQLCRALPDDLRSEVVPL